MTPTAGDPASAPAGPLVVVAGARAGDGRARLPVAVSVALQAAGATPFPLDTAPLEPDDGRELLAWFRSETGLRGVAWVGGVPSWAVATQHDVVLTWDRAIGALRLHRPDGTGALVAAMPAVPAAGVAGVGPPGPVGTLVVDGTGTGWPAELGDAGRARLVSPGGATVPATPATTVSPPAAATLSAWMAAAERVVVLGDPGDVDVAGWLADAAAAGHATVQPGATHPPLPAALADLLHLHHRGDAPSGVSRVHERAPRVSVVIPTFNSAPFVRATVESILEQTYTDLELVVVDDGSTDGTDEIVTSYAGDARLRLHRQANLGHLMRWEASNNRTWTLARGELVARLDGDDVAAPERLARQVAAFDADPRIGLVHTAGTGIDAAGRPLGPMFALPLSYDTRSQLRTVLAANVVAHPTVMVRRALLAEVEAYAGGWASDYDLWLRLARATRFRFLPEALVAYRVHAGGTSSTAAGAERSVLEGVAARTRARVGLAIAELVPELPPGPGALALAAAHVELAHHLLAVGGPPNAALALDELDRAQAVLDHPLIGVAAVAATLVAGDDDELHRRVARLEATAPGVLAQVRAELGPLPQVHGRMLWPDLGATPPEWSDDHVDAYGTPVGQVTFRWKGEDALRPVVAAYLERFRADDPVRLVLDLGPDVDAAMAQVAAALDGLEGVAEGAALELADGSRDTPGAIDLDRAEGGPVDVLDRVRRWMLFSDARRLR